MRLLLVALLLALATPASAKTLIVANTTKSTDANYGAGDAAHCAAAVQLLTSIFDAFGASYVVIPPAAMKTQWARIGVVTWDFGTSAARTESFDAVIHASFTRKHSGTPEYAGYRPDFLTIGGADSVPQKPQLFITGVGAAYALFAATTTMMQTATTCSLGVGAAGVEGGSEGSGSHDEESVYYQTGHSDAFSGTEVIGRIKLTQAGLAGRGIRTLIGRGTGPIGSYPWDLEFAFSTNWDSTGRQAAPDTVQLYMKQNTHTSVGKPIIVAHITEELGDGSGGLNANTSAFDIPVLMAALAALDSAAGGMVFDNKAKLPLKVALTVDGLCARSAATNSGGIVPSDTSRFYATLDSLNALGVAMVFGVNLDSAATYPRDLQYVKDNVSKARFSPQSRAGLDTSIAFAPTGGNTHRYRAVDTFGRYRNQSRAYGPNDGLAADTSLFAKLTYALALGDSMWGSNRTSRFALPPDDDWSPYNLRAWQADASRGVTTDSILYAYAKAGFRGIRINAAWDVGRPNLNPNNPRGYIPEQGRYSTADRSLSVNLIGHNGGSTLGNLVVASTPDSTVPGTGGTGVPSSGYYAASRFWHGLFGYSPRILYGASGADENSTGEVQRGRIFRVSAQELAGPPTLSPNYKTTQRPSWWAIRKVVMPVNIINRLAGRSIIQFDYPENITP